MIRYGGIIFGQPEIDAVTEVLQSGNWACGPVTAQFEEKAAAWQGRRHALFVNSGSSALLLAMAALPDASRVAMPALQFATLYSAAVRMGHTPVLVDIDDSLNMNPAELANAPADAAAFVHMAGNPSNICDVRQVCAERGMDLIEDACEAMGSRANGRLAGNNGLASAFSTHGAHHICTGEGGLVFTDDEYAYARMRSLRDWGRAQSGTALDGYYPGYVHSEVGFNLHASDMQAALGIVQLDRADAFIAARKANWQALSELTAGLPLQVPDVDAGCAPSWYTFPMLVAAHERNALIGCLHEAGVESRPVVAGNMARQPVCPDDPRDFPVADKWFAGGLWVSVHPVLTPGDLERIARSLRSFWS